MLHEFLTVHRDEIITRTREKLTDRPWPLASTSELENGVSLFLDQVSRALESDAEGTPVSETAIAASATQHGRELLSMGFNVSQVVHDYGDICQAITELVIERQALITPREFHHLNRCLDSAIAQAVTEHARVTALARASEETERTAQLAHEIRDLLNTAVFAFEALKRGTVAINGSTGAVLGRSLLALRDLIASTMSDIRLTANHQHRERISAKSFCDSIALAARLNADCRGVEFTAHPVAPEPVLHVDPQLLGSAVMNLLNNAFKFTRVGGQVVLRTFQHGDRFRIEVEDECGGILEHQGDLFRLLRNVAAPIARGSAWSRSPGKLPPHDGEILSGMFRVTAASSRWTFPAAEERRTRAWRLSGGRCGCVCPRSFYGLTRPTAASRGRCLRSVGTHVPGAGTRGTTAPRGALDCTTQSVSRPPTGESFDRYVTAPVAIDGDDLL